MTRRNATAIWALMVGVIGCADTSTPSAAAREAGCERFGKQWTLAAILEGALFVGDPDVQTARVLAWQITEDDRPLRVEGALLWIAFKNKQWRLTNLYRHPQDKSTLWQRSVFDDSPLVGYQSYPAPPMKAQLEDFLKATQWPFKPERHWRLRDSEVCVEAWKTAFNAPPWHQYEK